ncbi:hypothetical protein EMIT0158MI4_90155 [Burkholderia ambifaria]
MPERDSARIVSRSAALSLYGIQLSPVHCIFAFRHCNYAYY